jgi:hypothetical protein
MSLFFRTVSGRVPMRSQSAMRAAIVTTLGAYPLGCILMLISPDEPSPAAMAMDLSGLGLILLSVAAFIFIAPSYAQRIAAEQSCLLDDLERDLRRRAYAFAYQVMCGLALLGIFYLAVANDDTRIQLWAPDSYAHWNAVFWGVMLYAFTLPTAWLAWTMPAPVFDDEPEDAHGSRPPARPGVWKRRGFLIGLGVAGALAGFALAIFLGAPD